MKTFRSVGTELPVAIAYTSTLPLNAVNRPNQQAYFKNPYRAPMWVDAFEFGVKMTVSNVSLQLFSMRLKINGNYIIDDFVPLSVLGPHTDFTEFMAGNGLGYSFFWRLAKPLWLDEQDDISVELKFNGGLDVFDSATLTTLGTAPPEVTVTLKGRSTLNSKRPAERFLPFNVTWGPELWTTEADTGSFLRSPDSALFNGKDETACITRILSQAQVQSYRIAGNDVYTPNSALLLNLRLSHSSGYYIVKDLTPYFELFQNVSRSAAFKFNLKSKEFLTLELQTKTFEPVGYAEPMSPIPYLFSFGLQGYTVEALR